MTTSDKVKRAVAQWNFERAFEVPIPKELKTKEEQNFYLTNHKDFKRHIENCAFVMGEEV